MRGILGRSAISAFLRFRVMCKCEVCGREQPGHHAHLAEVSSTDASEFFEVVETVVRSAPVNPPMGWAVYGKNGQGEGIYKCEEHKT